MLLSLIVVIFLRCVHISRYQVVHLKYIQFLYVKDTSVKLFSKKCVVCVLQADRVWRWYTLKSSPCGLKALMVWILSVLPELVALSPLLCSSHAGLLSVFHTRQALSCLVSLFVLTSFLPGILQLLNGWLTLSFRLYLRLCLKDPFLDHSLSDSFTLFHRNNHFAVIFFIDLVIFFLILNLFFCCP